MTPSCVARAGNELMASQRHLPKAPIIEAVIDIQVDARAGATFEALDAAFADAPTFGYQREGGVMAGRFGFGLSATGDAPVPHAISTETIGLRLRSSTEPFVALVRTNGLTVSRLPPYKDWDDLEKEAQRIWALYVGRWAPSKVTRIATRYINNLNLLARHGQSYGDFIEVLTELPPSLPQMINGFLQQFQIAGEKDEGSVNLALAWDGRADQESGRIPVILDIDAFCQQSFDPSTDALWGRLKSLRDLKNRCFFGTLKEEALKEYE